MHNAVSKGPSRFQAALDSSQHVLQTGMKVASVLKAGYDLGKFVAPMVAAL